MIKRLIIVIVAILLVFTQRPALAQEAPTYTEEQLKQGEEIAQKAFDATNKGNFTQADKYWSQLIEQFPTNPALWSNRGNSRASQNKLEDAIADYNKAMELAPEAPDPYLNRGAVLEAQKKYDEAIADYNKVLEIDPKDAMGYNNRGNAEAGKKQWQQALADYQKAVELDPNFAFARGNAALVMYQIGNKEQALKEIKNIVRKYPMFPDMRAALTAILWENKEQGEAESNWVAAVRLDNRYQDIEWVENIRRWPPNMVVALDKFLKIQ